MPLPVARQCMCLHINATEESYNKQLQLLKLFDIGTLLTSAWRVFWHFKLVMVCRMFIDKLCPGGWVYLLPPCLFSVLLKLAFALGVPRTSTVCEYIRTWQTEFLVSLAPRGFKVLEILVGTTYNSTNQGSVWKWSMSSVTLLKLVPAPFSGCWLRWLLTSKKLSVLVQDWLEKVFYRNLGECELPEGRIHELHICISRVWDLTK